MVSHSHQLVRVGCQIICNISFISLREYNSSISEMSLLDILRLVSSIARYNKLIVMILKDKRVDEGKHGF